MDNSYHGSWAPVLYFRVISGIIVRICNRKLNLGQKPEITAKPARESLRRVFLRTKKPSKLPRIFRGSMAVPENLESNRKLSRNNKPEVDFFSFLFCFFFSLNSRKQEQVWLNLFNLNWIVFAGSW